MVMVIQILLNGLTASSMYLLIGLGFSLIYSATRFFNFAHGFILVAGAYMALVFSSASGLSIWPAALFAVVTVAVLGGLLQACVYGPLLRKGASSLVLLLVSLGLYIILQNVISLIFGDAARAFRLGNMVVIDIGHGRITAVQATGVCVSAALTVLVATALRVTKMGRALRAVANDSELAEVSGVECTRVTLWAFGVGSALAAVAGILMAADVAMTPTMGLNALMMGIVAVIIGGIGSVRGLVYGALLLGTAQHFGAFLLGAQWQNAIVFIILSVFMLVRPRGFMGTKVKKATV